MTKDDTVADLDQLDQTDAGTDESPDAGTDESPDAGTDESPDAGTDESPDAGTDESPDDVTALRRESARYRTRARDAENRAEEYGRRLFQALVQLDGRLADAADLPYSTEILDSDAGVFGAVDELLDSKPHLRTRRVAGNIGQAAGTSSTPFTLTALLGGA